MLRETLKPEWGNAYGGNVNNKSYMSLCLVTHRQDMSFEHYQPFLLSVIKGGVTSVQLREKTLSDPELIELASRFHTLLQPLGIPLIINDRVDICKEINAEGVHLGQTDGDPDEARKILGADKIIGLSIETPAQLEKANQLESINYIGVGPIFHTATKTNYLKPWGMNRLRWVTSNTSHPVIGIGSVNTDNILEIMSTGVSGVAVIGSLHRASEPQTTASRLRKAIDLRNEK